MITSGNVAQPVRERGALAARLLLDQLDGRGDGPIDVVVPTRLVVRSSTGPPRGV